MALAIQHLRVYFQLQQPWQQPAFSGSMLRGLFGHTFRQLACNTGHESCNGCTMAQDCAYQTVFEAKAPFLRIKNAEVAPPYALRIPYIEERTFKKGDVLVFDQLLFGPANQFTALIILAWQHAAKKGLGPQQISATLLKVDYLNQDEDSVAQYLPGLPIPSAQPFTPSIPAQAPKSIKLKFNSPLRLRKDKKQVKSNDLDSRTFLLALARRYQQLMQNYATTQNTSNEMNFQKLIQHSEQIAIEKKLHWHEQTRRSNRQKVTLPIGGLMGEIILTGDLSAYWPMLALLPWINLGKNCSFGLGACELSPLN